ncbi:MAG TPA: MFS transporter [Candidatus Acidoferrum sp.]|nr:MFS transporter [Candidatus Acidoferrum sp.]
MRDTECKIVNRGKTALAFVVLIGVLSFFADFAYEGARSVTGPFLGLLGASAVIISSVGGLGELLGYGLRLVSGPVAERTGEYWRIAIFGYILQLTCVPLLSFAHSWPSAAILILLERTGRAVRNPPRDAMLSFAAKEMGYGWGFGLHEALDQCGALVGPLVVAAVLAAHRSYNVAFGVLVIPVAVVFSLLTLARVLYPKPEDFEAEVLDAGEADLPRIFWIYLVGAALVAAGFADFSLIAYHVQRSVPLQQTLIPIFYSVAMAASGSGSLCFGRLFDRFGVVVLLPLTILSAAFAPCVFYGGFWATLAGVAVWGLGMGVHESIIPAAVSRMVARTRRPSAYGIFTGFYGIAWFLGSVVIGLLYARNLGAVVAFCVATHLAALPIFIWVASRVGATRANAS